MRKATLPSSTFNSDCLQAKRQRNYADADSWEEQTTTRDQFVPVTQSPQTARWNEEQQHLPTRLPGRPPSETISEAQLRIVGERVVFKCEAPGVSSYDSKISWEKFTGEMPKNYRIDDTNFIIPRLRKEDVGIYRCLVETINGDTHMSTVELKVGDYVPTFTGQTVLEVTPLERDEWQRLQIELSVRPTSPDGTIYHAELNPGQTNQQLFHNIALKRGHVVYTYDIGAGAGRIQSNDPIQLGEWSRIFVKSNPAQVSLNVNGQESNYTNSRPVPAILNIGDGQAHIGGMSSESQHYHRFGEKINFKGSISRLVVNDQLIDIGESATSPPELTLSLSSNECFIEPCQNNGQCLPAHEHEGYRCECDAEFEGTHCQFKTRHCSDKAECVTGICVESEWNQPKCVCPWRRYGSLCELEGHPGGIEDELLESPSHRDSTFRFNGETSFMSIQAPESSRHFRLSLNLTPVKTNTSQLIAYVSSGYSSKRSDYMALTLENEQFTAIYKTRDGREEVRSLERAEAGKTYNVGFLRTGKQIEVVVNGRSAMTSVELPVFASGTALYLGGLPPGMRPNEEISEHDFFQGCAAQINYLKRQSSLVNRELVRMDDERFNAKTGDLQPCVGEPAPVNVSITEIQQPLAFSRPKTTYATRPKTHLHGPPQKVEETQPDDALLYTIISSTTVAPRPTFQMDEHDRVLPNVYPESSESMEFEPLDISEEELEVSTLAPTISTTTSTTTPKPIVKTTQRPRTTTPPSPSPTIIWQTEESTGSLNVQQSTPPPTVYSRPEIPESRKKPDLTYTDRLPESTEIDSSSTEIDPRLRDSDKNKQSISQDPKLNEATDDYSKTDLDRHPANLTPTRETQKEDHLSTTNAYVNELEVDPYLTRFGIERMCRPSTCGEHGVCEPLNLTHVTCSCKDYYTGS
ncbi:Basement membrane proteoglycan [Aphelenchoides bicaudatus]|nr:Basement membrane proteoglycan [Aphelenchoides bicaudatus]